MRRAVPLLVVLALVVSGAPYAMADDGRIGGQPGNVHVVGSDDIRMEAETVQAVLYGRFAEYVVDFKFVNSGPAQTVRLGFPYGLDDKTGDWPPLALAGFLAYQDGKPLGVTLSTGTDGPLATGWFEHTATFSPGTTMIRVRYVTRPSVTAGIYPEDASESAPMQYAGMAGSTAWYPYTLHTGAGWAGTIGRAVIRYTASVDFEGWAFGTGSAPEELWGTRPAGFTRPDERTLQWIIENFEPLLDAESFSSPFDIAATYYEPSYQGYDGGIRPEWAQPPIAEVKASTVSPVAERGYPDQLRFPAENVLGDPSTSWISAGGNAAGAWLTLTAGGRRAMQELRIVPGYARTPSDYLEHGRPRRIEVRFDDGTVATFELADEPTVQRFPLSVNVRQATITITDVYPGSRYDDVAIAALELGGAPAPEFLTFEEALASDGALVDVSGLAVTSPVTPAPEDVATTTPDPPAEPRSSAALPIVVAVLVVIAAGYALARRRQHAA